MRIEVEGSTFYNSDPSASATYSLWLSPITTVHPFLFLSETALQCSSNNLDFFSEREQGTAILVGGGKERSTGIIGCYGNINSPSQKKIT